MTADAWATLVGYAKGLPGDALVPVRADLVVAVAGRLEAPPGAPEGRLGTAEDVVRRYGCGSSTARSWLASGWIPGAFRLGKLGWRFPLTGLEELDRRLRGQHGGETDLGVWRDRKRAGRAA